MINLDKPSLLVKGNLDDIKRYLHTLVDSLQYALEDNEGMILECREKLANYEDGNANIAELELEVRRNSAAVKSQAVTVGANATNIANLKVETADIKSTIEQQAITVSANTSNIASIQATTDAQGSNISLIAQSVDALGQETAAQLELKVGKDENDQIVSMINASADNVKINAEKLDIEGKTLNIKVESTNIEGELTADQINADGLEVTKGKVGGWTLGEMRVPITNNDKVTTIAMYSGLMREEAGNAYYQYETWLTPSGVSVVSQYVPADGSGGSPTLTTYKTWRQILAGS